MGNGAQIGAGGARRTERFDAFTQVLHSSSLARSRTYANLRNGGWMCNPLAEIAPCPVPQFCWWKITFALKGCSVARGCDINDDICMLKNRGYVVWSCSKYIRTTGHVSLKVIWCAKKNRSRIFDCFNRCLLCFIFSGYWKCRDFISKFILTFQNFHKVFFVSIHSI